MRFEHRNPQEWEGEEIVIRKVLGVKSTEKTFNQIDFGENINMITLSIKTTMMPYIDTNIIIENFISISSWKTMFHIIFTFWGVNMD